MDGEGEGCWSKVLEGGRDDERQDTRGWAVDQRTDNSAVGTREGAAGRQEEVVGVSGRSLDASLFSVKREARAPVGSEEEEDVENSSRRGQRKERKARQVKAVLLSASETGSGRPCFSPATFRRWVQARSW